MSDELHLGNRRYPVVPQIPVGHEFRCATCGRVLLAGYPCVPVPRDVTREDSEHEGQPVTDLLCVYCDPMGALVDP